MPERSSTTSPETTGQLAYDHRLDIDTYRKLLKLEGLIPPEDFAQKLLEFVSLVRTNQETNLGERYNVEISRVTYPIENNRILHPNYKEPFLDFIKNGYRHSLNSSRHNPVDDARDLADVTGFEKLEKAIMETDQPDAIFIIISPPGLKGSDYVHNFIDVFQLDQSNIKSIKMSRYTTTLSYQQHWQVAQELCQDKSGTKFSEELPEDPAATLKDTPIRTTKSLEEILKLFHPDCTALPLDKYRNLINVCTPFITNYINSIIDCKEESEIVRTYNAILKTADIYMGKDTDKFFNKSTIQNIPNNTNIVAIARHLGSQPILTFKTGCRVQGGLTIDALNESPFSPLFKPWTIVDSLRTSFNNEDEDTSDFQCPGYRQDGTKCTYLVRYGSGVRKCPECGLEATCG